MQSLTEQQIEELRKVEILAGQIWEAGMANTFKEARKLAQGIVTGKATIH